jgi:hypothetical protein
MKPFFCFLLLSVLTLCCQSQPKEEVVPQQFTSSSDPCRAGFDGELLHRV